eukprot:Skav226108  [mRNA]  locus=scaffold702:124007:129907:+ [translate_table: standard]
MKDISINWSRATLRVLDIRTNRASFLRPLDDGFVVFQVAWVRHWIIRVQPSEKQGHCSLRVTGLMGGPGKFWYAEAPEIAPPECELGRGAQEKATTWCSQMVSRRPRAQREVADLAERKTLGPCEAETESGFLTARLHKTNVCSQAVPSLPKHQSSQLGTSDHSLQSWPPFTLQSSVPRWRCFEFCLGSKIAQGTVEMLWRRIDKDSTKAAVEDGESEAGCALGALRRCPGPRKPGEVPRAASTALGGALERRMERAKPMQLLRWDRRVRASSWRSVDGNIAAAVFKLRTGQWLIMARQSWHGDHINY